MVERFLSENIRLSFFENALKMLQIRVIIFNNFFYAFYEFFSVYYRLPWRSNILAVRFGLEFIE